MIKSGERGSRRKTYLFFASHYLPHLGGVERYTYNVAKELTKRGNRVIIITSALKGQLEYEINGSIIIIRLPSIDFLGGRFPVLKYNRDARALMAKIRNIPIDYVVVNTRFYVLSYFGVKYAKRRKVPSIVIEHGTGHFTVNNKFFDFAGHIYEHMITWLVKRNTDRFYGVSGACNQWLEHFGIKAEGVLYNAVDMHQISEILEKDDTEIRKMIDYQEDDIIITYTGRLIREKGVIKLISAFREVRKLYPKVKLCIAGDGELYEKLLKVKDTGVKVLGKRKFEEIIQLLSLTRIYCLPTEYPEGLPTSVLEAIACKAYVITTEAGGSKEVIIDESYGTILKASSVREISGAVTRVIEDEDRAQKCIENANKYLSDNFTWKNTVSLLKNNMLINKKRI